LAKGRFTLTPKFLRGYLQVFREKGIKEGIKAVGLPVALGMFFFLFNQRGGSVYFASLFDCYRSV